VKKIIIATAGILSILVACDVKNKNIDITNLRCEYMVNPLGIDNEHPRLSWILHSDSYGITQKSCQVFVGIDSVEVSQGKGKIWESKKIKSGAIPISYNGQKLKSFTRYYWCLRIQDQSGKWSNLSPVAFFETGMMEKENWKGSWITDITDDNIKPAPYFRKVFETKKKVKSARAYIAVAGLYEFYLNGIRIGDHRLDPAFTRFDRRLLYVTYDVTDEMQEGGNVIGVLLGNGWFNYQSGFRFHNSPWRARSKFCMDLRITYEDGSEDLIKTGKDWKTHLSPVIFNSIYTGEHYDARLEIAGWNVVGFDDSAWSTVKLVGAPAQKIEAQILHPIRWVEKIPVKEMTRINNRTYLFDFGMNFSGVCQITVSGNTGTTIRLKHAEMLDKYGRADCSNIDVFNKSMDGRDPFQTDIFILSGNGEESFVPRFNYKGFRYVEVTADKPIRLSKENLSAWFMHSDVPVAGKLHSSNPTLNKIWEATNASYLSNLFGLPTDCPHREKCGWTNDAHIACETGLYNYDGITIYEKWLADHLVEQQANGVLPAFIPCADGEGYNWNNSNGVDITSSIAIIPWNIYLFYGDSRLLESCYESIKHYINHINDISKSGLTVLTPQ
jgi:alpha-L-rhamnosidase